MPADRYAVMGNPIAHSKSPRIHAAFAAQTGEALTYEAILVPLGGFADALEAFAQTGGRGLNVTVPFKEDAWLAAGERSQRAQLARAVNTIVLRRDGVAYGDNTDGVGLVRDLTLNQGRTLRGQRLLLLGAGGAARGAVGPLLEQNPARLVIANRTAARAAALAADFADLGPVRGGGYGELAEQQFDLIINATAASLQGEVPPLPAECLADGAWCYDLMYGHEPTAFLTWATAHSAARALDGLGMLVEQAAESFALWRGVRPETAPVIEQLRQG